MKAATWSWLLPPSVRVVDGPVRAEDAAVAALWPEEQAAIAKAVGKRRFEFAAGRACARAAMAQLGLPPAALPSGSDRSPVWPEGVVGSITHGSRDRKGGDLLSRLGWCAAAVAKSTDLRSLGIDLEPVSPLNPSLYRLVLTQREQRWIDALPEDQRAVNARLVFSAKEAFYKCQHACTRQLLDFLEVELEFDSKIESGTDTGTETGECGGEFHATLLRDAGELPRGRSFPGRYAAEAGWWITAVTFAPFVH